MAGTVTRHDRRSSPLGHLLQGRRQSWRRRRVVAACPPARRGAWPRGDAVDRPARGARAHRARHRCRRRRAARVRGDRSPLDRSPAGSGPGRCRHRSLRLRAPGRLSRRDGRASQPAGMVRPRVSERGAVDRRLPRLGFAPPAAAPRAPVLVSGIHARIRRSAARTRPFPQARRISCRCVGTGGVVGIARHPRCRARGDPGVAILLSE